MRWQFWARRKSQTAKGNEKIALPFALSDTPSAVRCPLCGKTFSAGTAMPCASCGLAKKCGLVMCPNCQYEFAV